MSSSSSRAYAGIADLHELIEFAKRATRARWPRSTYMKAGDVIWMLFTPGFDPYANIRLWFDRDGLAAYAWFEPPLSVDFDIRPGTALDDVLATEILQWAEERRRNLASNGREAIPKAYAMLGEDTLSTKALDSDHPRVSLLQRNGFRKTDRFHVLYSRALEAPIAPPELPVGLRLRHATDDDLDARVDVHRDAWSVWGQSRVTVETYRRLRAAPLYHPELDVVLEDAAGKFLSYCIGWADAANGIGHFEPVGCRPDSTGRGYARAVTVEGLRRMQASGLHTALVGTESINPRAQRLYKSCGFVEVDRAHYYVKEVA
jgi:ribosomal protein S18 acetylase RimI-like enzyme